MIKYQLAQAKRDFEIGYLTTWHIERAPLAKGGTGWVLILGTGNGAGQLVDARTKDVRIIKSLDSVLSILESIGFEVNALFQG